MKSVVIQQSKLFDKKRIYMMHWQINPILNNILTENEKERMYNLLSIVATVTATQIVTAPAAATPIVIIVTLLVTATEFTLIVDPKAQTYHNFF